MKVQIVARNNGDDKSERHIKHRRMERMGLIQYRIAFSLSGTKSNWNRFKFVTSLTKRADTIHILIRNDARMMREKKKKIRWKVESSGTHADRQHTIYLSARRAISEIKNRVPMLRFFCFICVTHSMLGKCLSRQISFARAHLDFSSQAIKDDNDDDDCDGDDDARLCRLFRHTLTPLHENQRRERKKNYSLQTFYHLRQSLWNWRAHQKLRVQKTKWGNVLKEANTRRKIHTASERVNARSRQSVFNGFVSSFDTNNIQPSFCYRILPIIWNVVTDFVLYIWFGTRKKNCLQSEKEADAWNSAGPLIRPM